MNAISAVKNRAQLPILQWERIKKSTPNPAMKIKNSNRFWCIICRNLLSITGISAKTCFQRRIYLFYEELAFFPLYFSTRTPNWICKNNLTFFRNWSKWPWVTQMESGTPRWNVLKPKEMRWVQLLYMVYLIFLKVNSKMGI